MEGNDRSRAGGERSDAHSSPIPVCSSDDTSGPGSVAATDAGEIGVAAAEVRMPFTSLSQVEADMALARVLQEQERAYMMLTMGGVDFSGSEGDSYEYDDYEEELENDAIVDGGEHEQDVASLGEEENVQSEDVDDEVEDYEEENDTLDPNVQDPVLDPADFENDEAYARALQEAEERNLRMLSTLGVFETWHLEDHEEHDGDPQDAWQDIDTGEYSYEELVALGEVIGTESRGLSADTIASLPSICYKAQKDDNAEQCVICRVEFEDGESLVTLPCSHAYHGECIKEWLRINKICPVCSTEVSITEQKRMTPAREELNHRQNTSL